MDKNVLYLDIITNETAYLFFVNHQKKQLL